MKTLVVHYSRSGNTSRIAEALARELGADGEQLFEVSDARRGALGWVCAPIRTFLITQRPLPRHVAFFCTCGGRGAERAFRQMARLSRRAPIATLVVRERELEGDGHAPRLAEYVRKLLSITPPARPNGPSRVSRA